MELIVTPREQFGKRVRGLRHEGFIPAELYGHGVENLHLAVDAKEFLRVFREAGENTVLNLVIGSEKRPALVHDIQKDYVSDEVTHIDFYEVRMDEEITARVPLEFIGESAAVKEQGGILNRTMSEIEVEALPADLPRRITVDLSRIVEINGSVYVKDLAVPKGVSFLVDPETAVATVTPPLKEEIVEKPVEVSEVKVESEEKKVEREKQKEEVKE